MIDTAFLRAFSASLSRPTDRRYRPNANQASTSRGKVAIRVLRSDSYIALDVFVVVAFFGVESVDSFRSVMCLRVLPADSANRLSDMDNQYNTRLCR